MKQLAPRNTLKFNLKIMEILNKIAKENDENEYYIFSEDLPEDTRFIELMEAIFFENVEHFCRLEFIPKISSDFIHHVCFQNDLYKREKSIKDIIFYLYEHFCEDIADLCSQVVHDLNDARDPNQTNTLSHFEFLEEHGIRS